MIKFINPSNQKPYIIFKKLYEKAKESKQINSNAICISSYSKSNKEVNARFVNLKFIDTNEFIFFSNYSSPKSKDFESHNQITALIYWNSINVQIRMKAKIKRTSEEFNNKYFVNRDKNKNALAISSDQSKTISSYEDVKKKFMLSLNSDDLTKCPKYWGGYSFTPYYFEFWEGHKSRLNKREVYSLIDSKWIHSFLQP